jgi:hypothetical protein
VQPGTLIGEAWAIYREHWRHLTLIAVVVYVAISALVLALAFLIGGWAVFVSLAGVFWLQGVLVKAVDDVRDGRADLSVRGTLESALPKINVLSATGIIASIAIGIGFLLLIVPGLILLTIWSVVIPAVMIENTGVFRAFGRSQELVRGNGWNVFVVILVTVALIIVAGLVTGLALTPIDPEWVESLIVNVVANTIVAPFVAVAWTLMYFRLRALETSL